MKTFLGMTGVSAACFAAGLVLFSNHDAGAAYERLHSSNCSNYYHGLGDIRHATAGLINLGSSTGIVSCPLPSRTGLAHSNITTVNVHGLKGQSMDAWVCVRDYNSASYQCGMPSTSSGSAFNVSVADLSALGGNYYGFPWLRVTLGANSALYGYYVVGS